MRAFRLNFATHVPPALFRCGRCVRYCEGSNIDDLTRVNNCQLGRTPCFQRDPGSVARALSGRLATPTAINSAFQIAEARRKYCMPNRELRDFPLSGQMVYVVP